MTGKMDETQGKMFIGGLPWSVTAEKLKEYFCKFGEIIDSVIMKNNQTGNSRGFGFVTYKDPSCVELVMSSGPHHLDGKMIDPKPDSAKNASMAKKIKEAPKVFVGGIPGHCKKEDLHEFFSKYGTVYDVHLQMEPGQDRHRGFGFVTFESQDVVTKLLDEHFVNIGGRQVEIKRAQPQNGRQQQGYGSQAVQSVGWGDPQTWAAYQNAWGQGQWGPSNQWQQAWGNSPYWGYYGMQGWPGYGWGGTSGDSSYGYAAQPNGQQAGTSVPTQGQTAQEQSTSNRSGGAGFHPYRR